MYSRKKDDFNSIIADTLNLNIHHKRVYIHTLRHLRINEHPYEQVSGLEKRFMMIIILIKMLMPSFWIRHYCEEHRHTKWIFEAYVLMKPVIFIMILSNGRYHHRIAAFIVIYLLADLFAYIVGILALSDIFVKPISIRRNLILLGANYGEIITGFAILYLYYHGLEFVGHNIGEVIGPLQALYYSMVTFSTVGYGDMSSANAAGMVLTMAQITCSIIFVGIILSSYVGKIKLRSE